MPKRLDLGVAMDIAAWLRELGLERYEPAFRENEIDAEVLPQLTESDLSALGGTLHLQKGESGGSRGFGAVADVVF
jgi:hypothetical protein